MERAIKCTVTRTERKKEERGRGGSIEEANTVFLPLSMNFP
jgi:hypothetical protein